MMDDEVLCLPEPKKRWFEPVTFLLMAVSSLATAWCSYQNSRWSGESSSLSTYVDRLERKASAQQLEAGQIEANHSRLWMEAMDAQIDGDEKLARFYTERFDEELKPACEKWIALNPLENPDAPPRRFVSGLYIPRFDEENREDLAEAAAIEAKADSASHHAAGYLGNTVLLATVLFFAGTAGKFDQRQVRWASFAFAVALFLCSTSRMVMLPVA